MSNQRQEWEASHGQERCVAELGGLFQGTAQPEGKQRTITTEFSRGRREVGRDRGCRGR